MKLNLVTLAVSVFAVAASLAATTTVRAQGFFPVPAGYARPCAPVVYVAPAPTVVYGSSACVTPRTSSYSSSYTRSETVQVIPERQWAHPAIQPYAQSKLPPTPVRASSTYIQGFGYFYSHEQGSCQQVTRVPGYGVNALVVSTTGSSSTVSGTYEDCTPVAIVEVPGTARAGTIYGPGTYYRTYRK